MIKARISSYRYRGPHSSYNPRAHRVMSGHVHYDWRYVIKVNDLTVVYRQGFCSWDKACASLERHLPDVIARLSAA